MRLLLVILSAIALLSCDGPRSGAGIRKIRMAIHREPVAFLPVRVAETLGYYQAEGVAVELSEVAGGSKALEALVGGSVDVAAASMSDVMLLAAEGRDVRGFFVMYTRPSTVLAIAPARSTTIRTVRDLKGRTVGVSAPGSWSHQFLNFLLVTNGLSPQDVSTVSVGMSASSIAALEHGTVDAAVLLASASAAFADRHADSTFMVDTRTPGGARQVFGADTFPSLGLAAEESWLRGNTDTAQRLVRAVKRGMDWVRNHPPEQVRGMIPVAARMSDIADLQSVQGIQQGLSTDGRMPPGAPELILKFVAISNPSVLATHIEAAQIYTNDFASGK